MLPVTYPNGATVPCTAKDVDFLGQQLSERVQCSLKRGRLVKVEAGIRCRLVCVGENAAKQVRYLSPPRERPDLNA